MNYQDIFRPDTLSKLNKRSQENLKKMMGNKTLMQTMISSTRLLQEIMAIEAPYKDQLEALAVQMAEDMYPIILEDNIRLDAKIVSMGDVNKSLDEITINKPGNKLPLFIEDGYNDQPYFQLKNGRFFGHYFEDKVEFQDVGVEYDELLQYLKDKHIKYTESGEFIFIKKEDTNIQGPLNENTPESKRRVINGITQGAALNGTFSFYMFKEYLDAIDDTLVEKYNQLMKEVFGVYDDDNAIAMFLQIIAGGQKMGGGSSKVVINEITINNPNNITPKVVVDYIWDNKILNLHKILTLYGIPKGYTHAYKSYEGIPQDKLNNLYKELQQNTKNSITEQQESGVTIQARAICFPMLVHEIIKGLYELVSLHGFQGDKQQNQDVVDKVDKLENEPHDLKYGKFIYEALNNIFAESSYSDPRIREFFFQEVYQLGDNEFLTLIENSINEELTPQQKRWVDQTLKEIAMDLKSDDFDSTGLDEITINKPGASYDPNRSENIRKFEFGKNVRETLYNFIKTNQYLSEKQIVTYFSDSGIYNPKTIQDNIRRVPDLKRQQVLNPITKKKTYVYHI